MEKIIILSFVLLACVCLICQGASPSVAPTSATATTASPSVAPNATTPEQPSTGPTSPSGETKSPKTVAGATTKESGAVSVKSFAGLVFSFFVIALL